VITPTNSCILDLSIHQIDIKSTKFYIYYGTGSTYTCHGSALASQVEGANLPGRCANESANTADRAHAYIAGKCTSIGRYPGSDIQPGEWLEIVPDVFFESVCVDACLANSSCTSAVHNSSTAECFLKSAAVVDVSSVIDALEDVGGCMDANLVVLTCLNT
jgi:hypothetical protein